MASLSVTISIKNVCYEDKSSKFMQKTDDSYEIFPTNPFTCYPNLLTMKKKTSCYIFDNNVSFYKMFEMTSYYFRPPFVCGCDCVSQ